MDVLPALKDQVFVSTQLEKGVRWFEEIVRALEGAEAGILCITSENLCSPWLHFEAGALAKGLHASPAVASGRSPKTLQNRIFTFLHGISAASLDGPLAHYQSTTTTREDTWSLIKALAQVLTPAGDLEKSLSQRFKTCWPAFENDLKAITVKVQELLPQFETWFRRKTFDEPLQHCTDQNWSARYDGARQSHDRLSEHAVQVRKACPRYQIDLYEQLISIVESYAMDIRALLLKAPKFELSDSGRLAVVPAGIQAACENRRGHIKEIVSRMLDPLAIPATEQAAEFWMTDSFDHRKLLVHRKENAILAERDRRPKRNRETRFQGTDRGFGTARFQKHHAPKSYSDFPGPQEARKLFESIWDLDRIFGYLVTEYLYPDTRGAIDGLRQAAVMEIERFRAKPETASLMPLHYALGALKAALTETKRELRPGREALALEKLIVEVEQLIYESRPPGSIEPALDRGRQVRRTIAEIKSLLPEGKEPVVGVDS
jgi:hypothetical protein